MGAKWTPPGPKKRPFCKILHFGAQNAFWALFAVWAQKERKLDLGWCWAPKCLIILRKTSPAEMSYFCKKVVFGEEKATRKCFFAQHKNMKHNQKWKRWFPHLSARSAKPFINVTFWARFFDQNRKNAIFPLLGAKKWKWANFSLLGRFWRQKRSRTEK